MSSDGAEAAGAGSFSCVLCHNETSFPSRAALQHHFRQHGDPNLHAIIKTGTKRPAPTAPTPGNVGAGARAGSGEQREQLVSCDVCSEVFPSVGKAITHKHKFHRDHTHKHFCSWCGKLFPIKHLFDKHIVLHASQVQPEEKFKCDQCEVEFFTSAAVSYHNRSFHRADALDLPPGVGLPSCSKKHKLVNKDLVQIYFCHLCGCEYINTFNLQKHITDRHAGEPDWSDTIFRCPLCDAVFNSSDAYAAHLTFHTPHDIYIDGHDIFKDLTEFTVDTVPPTLEHMEPPEDIDIEKLLAVDLELSSSRGSQEASNPPSSCSEASTDSKPKPNAPRKAITLNQFFSMNKDVFGDVLDFQGVEEIPSQVVANQHRPKRPRPQAPVKPGTKIMSMDNLQKLKQQGVVVQMKQPANKSPAIQVGSRVTVANGVQIGRPIKIANSAVQQTQRFTQPRPVLKKVMKPPMVQGAPPRPMVPGKPLKMLANVAKTPTKVINKPVVVNNKKPGEDSSMPGPFSCFKKPKESLIPISDVPGIAELLKPEPSVSSPTQAGKINVSPANKTVKPNPSLGQQPKPTFSNQAKLIMSNQTKPAVGNQAKPMMTNQARPTFSNQVKQSLSNQAKPTFSNQVKQSSSSQAKPTIQAKPAASSQVKSEDRSSQDGHKNKTEEALEKLKRQGLLIKKPRLESDDSSREDSQKSDAPCLSVKSGG